MSKDISSIPELTTDPNSSTGITNTNTSTYIDTKETNELIIGDYEISAIFIISGIALSLKLSPVIIICSCWVIWYSKM